MRSTSFLCVSCLVTFAAATAVAAPKGVNLVAKVPADTQFRALVPFGGRVAFQATTPDGTEGLWISDGSDAGTTELLRDPGLGGELVHFKGQLWFACTRPGAGVELCSTHGSAGSVTMAADLAPGSASSAPRSFAVFGSHLYFFAEAPGFGLYRTDGVTTTLVRALPELTEAGRGVVAGPYLYFSGTKSSNRMLFRTDGTAAGTIALAPGLFPNGAVGTKLLCEDQVKWWISDGTPAGTKVLAEIRPGASHKVGESTMTFVGANFARISASLGDRIVFGANDGSSGFEPWISDGTGAGTRRIADVLPGAGPGLSPRSAGGPFGGPTMMEYGGKLYFQSMDNASGIGFGDLWVTDGTAAGTRSFRSGPEGDGASRFVKASGWLYYYAANEKIYRTNGAAVEEVAHPGFPSNGASPVSGPVASGDKLFVAISVYPRGRGLYWASLPSGCNCGDGEVCTAGVCGPGPTTGPSDGGVVDPGADSGADSGGAPGGDPGGGGLDGGAVPGGGVLDGASSDDASSAAAAGDGSASGCACRTTNVNDARSSGSWTWLLLVACAAFRRGRAAPETIRDRRIAPATEPSQSRARSISA